MNNSLRHRIEALEQRLISEPVVLHMPDGSERTIRGGGRYFLKLCGLDAESANHPLSCELGWLRDCESISGEGAEAFNLLRVLAQGPNEEPEDPEILHLLEARKGQMQ